MGSNGFMSFQIRLKLRELHADDLVRNGPPPSSPSPPRARTASGSAALVFCFQTPIAICAFTGVSVRLVLIGLCAWC